MTNFTTDVSDKYHGMMTYGYTNSTARITKDDQTAMNLLNKFPTASVASLRTSLGWQAVVPSSARASWSSQSSPVSELNCNYI